jgi:hypothetical protein
MYSIDIRSYWQVKALIVLLKLSLLVGAVLSFFEGHLEAGVVTLAIFFITFLPILLGNRFQVKIPSEFELLAVILVYASLFLGEVHSYYLKFWWWDLVLHTSSGFLLGILGFLLVYVLNEKKEIDLDLKPGFVALFAFAFAIAFGTYWEIFEFAMDQTFGTNMQKSGLIDTMWDLIVNSIGALIISLLGWGYLSKEGINSFLEKWIHKFIERNPHMFERRKFPR